MFRELREELSDILSNRLQVRGEFAADLGLNLFRIEPFGEEAKDSRCDRVQSVDFSCATSSSTAPSGAQEVRTVSEILIIAVASGSALENPRLAVPRKGSQKHR